MDALGIGDYASSSESEDEVDNSASVEVKPAKSISPPLRPQESREKSKSPSQSFDSSLNVQNPNVGAFDGYESSDSEMLSSSIEPAPAQPSEDHLNLKPPAVPGSSSPPSSPPPIRLQRSVSFPPSPRLKPNPEVQQKIRQWVTDIRSGELEPFAASIQGAKEFWNPYLLTMTCKEFRIAEYSTNFSPAYKRQLSQLADDHNSYLRLREKQIHQVKQREKRRQHRKEKDHRASKKRKVERGTYLNRNFSTGNIGNLPNISAGFLRKLVSKNK